MNDDLSAVAEAFSRKSSLYDAFGQHHPNLERMRAKVRRRILTLLHPGESILELNAGTGADAAFFARLGNPVHAIDISPGMLAEIERKIALERLGDRLTVQNCSFEHLDRVANGPFDLIFSNMGGLNCTGDLSKITRQLPGLLRLGGRVVWVIMPPVCLWELGGLLRGRFGTAFRRLRPGGVIANVEGVPIKTYYYTPRRVLQAFDNHFFLLKLEGLSVFTPTADRKDFPLRYPRAYHYLRWLDERCADLPVLRLCGDFFILSLEYRP